MRKTGGSLDMHKGHVYQLPTSLGNLRVNPCQQAWNVGCGKEPNALLLVNPLCRGSGRDSGKTTGIPQKASSLHVTKLCFPLSPSWP